jgi:IclR family KDG regulon transcriptional repressor
MGKVANRTLQVLSKFSIDKPCLTVDELSRFSEMPLSTIYRFLNSLLRTGYLMKDARTQTYSVGPEILRLARVADAGMSFRTLAIPWVEKLFAETGKTIYLTSRIGTSWICLENRVRPGMGSRFVVRAGETAPIYAGCPGRVLLAGLSDTEVNNLLNEIGLVKLTPYTITDRGKIMKELAEIRKRGYHLTQQQYQLGAWGLGAPIFDSLGRTQAALIIAGVISNEDKPQVAILKKNLLEATRNISKNLGYSLPESKFG